MKKFLHKIILATIVMATSLTHAQTEVGPIIASADPAAFQYNKPVTWIFDLSTTTEVDGVKIVPGMDLYLWIWTPSEPDAGNYPNSSEFAKLTYVSDMIWKKTLTPTEYFPKTTAENKWSSFDGWFWFLLKNQDGSIKTQAASITGGTLSNNTFAINNNIAIYPNPATDQITIDFGSITNLEGNHVQISNTLGQVVFNQTINTRQYVIPVNNLARNSMYFVKVQDAKGNVLNTKKILLK